MDLEKDLQVTFRKANQGLIQRDVVNRGTNKDKNRRGKRNSKLKGPKKGNTEIKGPIEKNFLYATNMDTNIKRSVDPVRGFVSDMIN